MTEFFCDALRFPLSHCFLGGDLGGGGAGPSSVGEGEPARPAVAGIGPTPDVAALDQIRRPDGRPAR